MGVFTPKVNLLISCIERGDKASTSGYHVFDQDKQVSKFLWRLSGNFPFSIRLQLKETTDCASKIRNNYMRNT